MSKMLFDSQPLVVDPDLAIKVGLNEAIILQQLHYWTEINRKAGKNKRDGYTWTYNSYEGWKEQFPFWSIDTIKRTITRLKKKDIIITDNYNKMKMDRTTWYRINYEVLSSLKKSESDRSGQNALMDQGKMTQWKNAKCTNGSGQNDPTSTRDFKENKKEIFFQPKKEENKKQDETENPFSELKKILASVGKPL